MKKIVLIVSLLLVSIHITAQNTEQNLIGIQEKCDYLQEPYADWFAPNYAKYQPDMTVVNELKKHLDGITIKAFMGTWCGDSKRETPAFYKILDKAGFDFSHLTMIAVNRDKATPDNLQEGMNITNVPTFIFYKNGKEIGRFVEFPRETLEKDILKIVSGKPYKHSYEE